MKGLYLFQRYLPFMDIVLIFVTSQSDVDSYLPMPNFYLDQMGEILQETGCQKVYCAQGW